MRKASKCTLVDYKYDKDRAIGTYVQDQSPILKDNYEARKNSDIHERTADLDMGFKFASIPKSIYIQMQQMGIADDPQAIMKFLEQNPQYKTTNKRLI
jgi:hypothetical protein